MDEQNYTEEHFRQMFLNLTTNAKLQKEPIKESPKEELKNLIETDNFIIEFEF